MIKSDDKKGDRAADKGPSATCKLYCVILFTSLFNLKAPGSLKSVLKGKQRANHASTSLKLRGLTWLYRKGWREDWKEDWREEKEDQCHNTKITLHDLCSAMDFRKHLSKHSSGQRTPVRSCENDILHKKSLKIKPSASFFVPKILNSSDGAGSFTHLVKFVWEGTNGKHV